MAKKKTAKKTTAKKAVKSSSLQKMMKKVAKKVAGTGKMMAKSPLVAPSMRLVARASSAKRIIRVGW